MQAPPNLFRVKLKDSINNLVDLIEGKGVFQQRHYIYVGLIILLLYLVIFRKFVFYRSLEIKYTSYYFVDFDCFYLAGQLAAQGKSASAYLIQEMMELQYALSGNESFLPFTYPPPFLLLLAALSFLKKSTAYLLFSAMSLSLYLWIMQRLARENFIMIMILIFPAMIFCVQVGQSGLLVGSLAGCVVYFLSLSPRLAGLSLGAMFLKPHMSLAISFYALLACRWRALRVAVMTGIAMAVISTIPLGISIWPVFFKAVDAASVFLGKGYYPLQLMISSYAVSRTIGLSASAAYLIHAIIAMGILLAIYFTFKKMDTVCALGIACLASPLISPYAYLYDLPIVGVGLAILAPYLFGSSTKIERSILYLLLFLAGLIGQIQHINLSFELEGKPFIPLMCKSISGLSIQLFFWGTWGLVVGKKLIFTTIQNPGDKKNIPCM